MELTQCTPPTETVKIYVGRTNKNVGWANLINKAICMAHISAEKGFYMSTNSREKTMFSCQWLELKMLDRGRKILTVK